MEPESIDVKSNMLFSAIMTRYEDLSENIARMSAAMTAPYRRWERTSTLAPYLRGLKFQIVDFVNFARFHQKFYQQIARSYRLFLHDTYSYLGEKNEKRYARKIQTMWGIIQKAMIDQKLIELKGV